MEVHEARRSRASRGSVMFDKSRLVSLSESKILIAMSERRTQTNATNVTPISLLSESGADVLSLWSVLFMQSLLLSMIVLLPLSLYFGLPRWMPQEVFKSFEAPYSLMSRMIGQALFASVVASLLLRLFDYRTVRSSFIHGLLPVYLMVSFNNILTVYGFTIWVWTERLFAFFYIYTFYYLDRSAKKLQEQEPNRPFHVFLFDGTVFAVCKGALFSIFCFLSFLPVLPAYFESSFGTQLFIRLVIFNSITCLVDHYQLYVLKDLSPDLIQQRMEVASVVNAYGQFLGRMMVCNTNTDGNSKEFLIMCLATTVAEILFRVTYNMRYHAFVRLMNWWKRSSQRGWIKTMLRLRILKHANRIYHEHMHASNHKGVRTIVVESQSNAKQVNVKQATPNQATVIRVREQDEYEQDEHEGYHTNHQDVADAQDNSRSVHDGRDASNGTQRSSRKASSLEDSVGSFVERDIFGNPINRKRVSERPYELPSPLLEMRSKQIMDEIASDIRVSILVPFFLYLTHPFFAGSSVQTIDSMFECVWQAGTQIIFEFFCDLVSLYVEMYYYRMPLELSVKEAWSMSGTLGLISCFSIFNLFNYITLSVMKYDYSVF